MSDTLAGKHALSGEDPDDVGSGAPVTEGAVGAEVELDGQPTTALEPADAVPAVEPLEPPLAVPVTPGQSVSERVTCPECGTVAEVALARRESTDFCTQCDFPLFWTPTKVVLASGDSDGESLRRLPGASGRVTVGSTPCPHCAEENLVTAEVCIRCGGLMNPPPAPEPVLVLPPPPPPPLPEPEPEPGTPMWVWLVATTTLFLLVALIAYGLASR